uniref:Uncharacterized protein n=1 Tax=Anguilla anguilla TaxID=7936 RepID=A0A0E9S8F5_ANGAN
MCIPSKPTFSLLQVDHV